MQVYAGPMHDQIPDFQMPDDAEIQLAADAVLLQLLHQVDLGVETAHDFDIQWLQ